MKIADLVKNIDLESVQAAASKAFNRCSVKGCKKFSLGFQCVECNRFACNGHLFFKASTPPRPWCGPCISALFPREDYDA